MKRHYFLLFILTAFISFSESYATSEKRVSSSISNVNVYLNRAQVQRTGKVSIGSGTTDIVLTGLTTKLDPNSIQVSGKGNFIIMSVKHQRDYLDKNQSSEKAKGLQKQIDSIDLENRRLNGTLMVLKEEKDLLLNNRSIAGTDNGVSSAELQKISTYFRTRRMAIDDEYLTISEKVTKNNEKKSDLKQQLYEINRNSNTASSNIVVSVASKSTQQIILEFDYMVYNAGWVPLYDIRATEGKNKVQLSYKAQIYQNTDIDWKNVNISVSTGNPAQGGNKPTLSPWYLAFNTQTRSSGNGYSNGLYGQGSRNVNDALNMVGGTVSADDGGTPNVKGNRAANKTYEYTSVSQTNLATTFEIALKQTIPSDNKKYTVDIQKLDIDASFAHSSVPKLDPDAFLMAHLTDWEGYNLLSGNANVFYDGSFVGNTYMNLGSTTDTLSVSLGRDKKVIIKRDKIKDFCKTKTFGSNIKKTIGYEITVKNTKKEEINLSLEDHYPVSSNSNAEVTLIEKSGAKDKGQGKLSWETTLQPGETKSFILKFEVKYNKKYNISNL